MSVMMADMNAETIQQRIQIARRDAEALRDRIKRKKDELADTTRQYSPRPGLNSMIVSYSLAVAFILFQLLTSSSSS
jgi:hypothetical protein